MRRWKWRESRCGGESMSGGKRDMSGEGGEIYVGRVMFF